MAIGSIVFMDNPTTNSVEYVITLSPNGGKVLDGAQRLCLNVYQSLIDHFANNVLKEEPEDV